MAVGVTETSELAFAGTTACHELLAAEFLARACQICLCIEYLQNVLVPVVGGYPLQSSSRAAKVQSNDNIECCQGSRTWERKVLVCAERNTYSLLRAAFLSCVVGSSAMKVSTKGTRVPAI